MTIPGVDYAWQRPAPDGLKKAGHRFAMRYLSHDPSKNLTGAERDALWAQGIAVGLVWESTANRALAGAAAGAQDARDASQQAFALGLQDIPVYFAADWDVTPAQKPKVAAYLQGAVSELGKNRVGVYGGYWVIKYIAEKKTCAWFWQTYAWSGGNVHPEAHIYQHKNGVQLAGGNVDLNKASTVGLGSLRGPKAVPSGLDAKTKRRYRDRIKALDSMLRAHPKWPANVRKALRWTRDRYKRALGGK